MPSSSPTTGMRPSLDCATSWLCCARRVETMPSPAAAACFACAGARVPFCGRDARPLLIPHAHRTLNSSPLAGIAGPTQFGDAAAPCGSVFMLRCAACAADVGAPAKEEEVASRSTPATLPAKLRFQKARFSRSTRRLLSCMSPSLLQPRTGRLLGSGAGRQWPVPAASSVPSAAPSRR